MKNFNQELVKKSLKLDKWLRLILFFLKTKAKSKKNNVNVNNILIFEFHLLGDVVMLSAFLLEVRKHFPDAHIGLVAGPWARDILKNHPNLYNSFFSINAPWVGGNYNIIKLWQLISCILHLRQFSWDLGIETRGDLRQILMLRLAKVHRRIGYEFTGGSWLLTDVVPDDGSSKHLIDYHLQIIQYICPNFKNNHLTPKLWLSDIEKAEVNNSFSRIGLHFGASVRLRRISKVKANQLLQVLLSKFNEPIMLFQTPEIHDLVFYLYNNLDDQLKSRVIIFSGSLRKFCVEISKCSLFVGMDSAGGHIAAALNIPVWSVFGPTRPIHSKPIGKIVKVISLNDSQVLCRPCDQKVCTNVNNQFCMNMINWNDFI